jgi:uncharacterized protein (TIGR03086 family)
MTAPVEIWRQVADRWTEVYAQIGDDQWQDKTPCEGWTVRELVDHLQWHATALNMLGADTTPGDSWDHIRSALDALLSDPAHLQGAVDQFGGMPAHDLAAFLIGDRLIHTWDLARSIGVDDDLPTEAVAATMAGLQHAPPEFLRGRSPLGLDMMGTPVDVPEDSDDQDKMLAFSGRQP